LPAVPVTAISGEAAAMTVIRRDFGNKTRVTVQNFRERLSLDALHELNIKANPLPYLERAAERIFQLERALFEAAQLFREAEPTTDSPETILVDKAQYERLLLCREIVEKALADHGRDEEL
jgi:hypothetical protein